MIAFAFSIVAIVSALLAAFGFVVLSLFFAAMWRAMVWRKRQRVSAKLMPQVREALVNYLGGAENMDWFRAMARKHRDVLADGILSFKGTVSGGALDRLCGLAMELELVGQWVVDAHSRNPIGRRIAFERLAFVSTYEPSRRSAGDILLLALKDADPDVRLAAARGVTNSASREDIERAFDFAVSQNLLVRILVAEPLRRHSSLLCETTIPEAFRSSDSSRVIGTLELLAAWERAIPLENLQGLYGHQDKRVRIQILSLTPLVMMNRSNRAALVNALSDPDPDVSTAAALSAGRLKIADAIPSLARLLRLAQTDVARSAAAALAEMPPRGWLALEEFCGSANPVTAAVAAEALARARKAGE